MTSGQLASPPAPAFPTRTMARPRASGRLAEKLLLVLLVLFLLCAFSHGGIGVAAEARLQVALAALAAVAGAAWLWAGSLRPPTSRTALMGAALLLAFALWSGVSVLWSVDPDSTWFELNRTVSYLIVLSLGMALGATSRRSVVLAPVGFLILAVAITLYALGQKLLPGFHIAGLFDLNQTASLPRLEEPLGYWNALALLLTLAAPVALVLTAERGAGVAVRVASAVTLSLMLLTLGFTYSRGGILALVVAMVVTCGLSRSWLRYAMWFTVATVAAVPPLVLGLTNHALTGTDASLGRRETAGILLLVLVLLCAAALAVGAHALLRVEARVQIGADVQRRVTRVVQGALAVVVLAVVLAVTFSDRGLEGTVSQAWRSFTTTRSSGVLDPSRLLSTDSENRWVWWKEAAGAFSDRPVAGWGAGSFPVVHLLYRRDNLSVKQPHSLPLQWLAETGAIGAILGLGALAVLLLAAARSVRAQPRGPTRMLMVAMLAASAAYAAHCLYDWDWDIPGVTFPVLLFLGLLAGVARTDGGTAPRELRQASTQPWMRLSLLAACTGAMCVFALSAALPSLANSRASSAAVTAATGSGSSLQQAARSASLASELDPLDDSGLKVEASIDLRLGLRQRARELLLQAADRDPTDPQAWGDLGYAEIDLGDLPGAQRAAQRALALDPQNQFSRGVVASVGAVTGQQTTPPQQSPTATALP